MNAWICGGCKQIITEDGHNCAHPAGTMHAQKRGGPQPVIPKGCGCILTRTTGHSCEPDF